MKRIDPKELEPNPIDLIGSQWMLVTSGDMDSFNTMTASWGGVGFLWNKPVAFVFIRPQRYTFEFVEKNDMFTLSFFGEEWRKALTFCGSHSGRDTDKIAMTGLSPYSTPEGSVAFREASIVLECRKLYRQDMEAEAFLDPSLIEQWYPQGDFHRCYVAQIVNAWAEE